jgi:mono/diheme cytochrome c family protein
MEIVTPGDPHGSKLYKVITNINGENLMPPKQPLSKEQRTLIQIWIAQGAHNKTCNTAEGGNSGGNTGNSDSICFVQDILPVILSSCGTTGCHDATTQKEGYVLTDYANILKKGIVPGNASASKIYSVVIDNGEDRMPPSPRSALTSTQISALRKWIQEGAKNSDCPPAVCDTTGTISFSAQVFPIFQANCIGCHNSSTANGGVNLNSYSQIKASAALRNGTPLIQGVIRRMPGFIAMPQTFALDECSIRKIELWIAQGLQNN